MKDLIIKAWPELTGYKPSTIRIERSAGTKHPLYFDFAGCKEISSTGLTVWLLRSLSFLKQSKHRREYSTELFKDNEILYKVRQLSFFYHLNRYIQNNNMFTHETNYDGPFETLYHTSFNNREVISLPIYCLNLNSFTKEKRRDVLYPLRSMLMEVLSPYGMDYYFNQCQFISIVSEMCKNSADHTNGEAFLGLDFVLIPEKKSIEIHFVFGDLGCGIKKNVQKYLFSLDEQKKRIPHMSFSEAYRRALTRGFTTKPNSEYNKGIGMSLIREGCQGIGVELSVFDAFSRYRLSSVLKLTHEELRRYFYPFTKDQTQPFYYYGVIRGEKK